MMHAIDFWLLENAFPEHATTFLAKKLRIPGNSKTSRREKFKLSLLAAQQEQDAERTTHPLYLQELRRQLQDIDDLKRQAVTAELVSDLRNVPDGAALLSWLSKRLFKKGLPSKNRSSSMLSEGEAIAIATAYLKASSELDLRFHSAGYLPAKSRYGRYQAMGDTWVVRFEGCTAARCRLNGTNCVNVNPESGQIVQEPV